MDGGAWWAAVHGHDWAHQQRHTHMWRFPGAQMVVSACSAGDPGVTPGQEDPPEKGMATHSSILTWGIPCTEEPGRLHSMGSQRV